VLLRNGRALALKGALRDARAILVTWFLGTQTGPAISDVLFGAASPSGRLPVSFPQTAGQVPYYYSHKRTGRPQLADDPGRFYKARYLDATNAALFPFGWGLTYSSFRYEAVEVRQPRMPWNGRVDIRATITNSGKREAEEVVQLYIRNRSASVTRPVRELKGFRKVKLAPGESTEVDFVLRRDDLMFVGQGLRPTVEPGQFDVWIAPSAVGGVQSSFTLMPD
jgi:beta-glucosidase